MQINSKLPNVGTTIFTVMSALANEHKAINLSQGFPNYDCAPRLKELVDFYVKNGYNQYAPMAGAPELRNRLAQKAKALYAVNPDPNNEITITAGATQAIYTAISAFVGPGDEVILFDPAYDSYAPSVEVNGGVPVVYSMKAPDYKIDWDIVAKMVSDRTRMIVINSPHNPTGSVLSASDMAALQAITKDSNIIILSDEVYEHLIYDGLRHESILHYPELWKRSLVTYSFGKTFHNTGWKLGYCMAPTALMVEFRKVHQFNVFCVNHPLQRAIADFMEDPNEYLGLGDFYQAKRDFFLSAMEGSSFRPLPSRGTYFQLFDYSSISQEKDTAFAKRMTMEYGVAAIPVSVFYADGHDDKVVRLCFAKTEDLLEQAGTLLRKI